ncbi:MAG: fibrillarin-like rRNA/tRNA 2'-O-methyltransferase [Methanomassiliicoccales archaeon]|nr:MAG: fibrillarin-like rRNA/tRNA 2'-O-methyltransferase [Methanomassiliicoccales archaeon]
MKEIRNWKFHGVFTDGERLLTRNLVPENRVYGEELVRFEGKEYRVWNPKRSKACAMLRKGSRYFPINEDSKVLYLGAANGTTASHLSDIVGKGMVFCVEFSKRAFRDLITVSENRKNMIPIFADANRPEIYRGIVGKTDVVYQDISQRDQTKIFLKNVRNFLSPQGFGILMVKARSIDVSAKPKDIFNMAQFELKDGGLKVLESVILKPYEKDHAAIVIKR